MKGKIAVVLILFMAGGFFAWTAGQCFEYAFWNRALTAENRELSNILADRNQTVDEKTAEIEGLQAQLADRNQTIDEKTAEIEKLLGEKAEEERKRELFSVLREGEIRVGIYEERDCDELGDHLKGMPGCSVRAEIGEWGLDVEQAANALRRHWEQGDGQDGYYVSMTLHPDLFQKEQKPVDAHNGIQEMQNALCTLAGAEYAEMIQDAMEQEEGYLWFVRLEQIGELNCCTFEISEPVYSPAAINERAYTPDLYQQLEEDDIGCYYIAVAGKWEGKEVKRQYFCIPYTFGARLCKGVDERYEIEGIDVNFDGKRDMLIHNPVGESRYNCRVLVWQEETGQFAYFPSFPEEVYLLQADRRRVVDSGGIGELTEYVLVYEIVNGEYVCTQKLICKCRMDETYELSYYEMGEPANTHHLSSDWEEMVSQRAGLYPDMDYWLYR